MRELRTRRLILRGWRESDLAPFAALNADPRVMEHFAAALPRAESDALARRIENHFARHGFGLWAVEVPGVVDFAGFIGLSIPLFDAQFTPCVEIGWRMAYEHWRLGYTTEGAREVMRLAFDELQLEEVVSFTVAANRRSRSVMKRIGMSRDLAGDFDHPSMPAGHPLRGHVLYRLSRGDWWIRTTRQQE